jgi:hypothetical protein
LRKTWIRGPTSWRRPAVRDRLTGGQDATTRGGGLLLGSFGGGDQGVEPLLEDLSIDGWKGDDVRWREDRRRGGGGDQGVEPLLEGLGVGGRKGDDV